METINAIYKDGVLVLIDKLNLTKLKSKKISVNIIDEELHKNVQINKLTTLYKNIHKSNPFSGIKDVVKWQRKIRIDREISN